MKSQCKTRSLFAGLLSVLLAANGIWARGEAAAERFSSPTASQIYVVDLIKAESFPRKMADTLATFQGVVNRDRPRLFVIRYDEDYFWLSALEKCYGFKPVALADPWLAFDKPDLKERCDGLIVYGKDDCELASNVAVTLAGLRGCAIFEGNDRELADIQKRGFTVKEDIRGRWKTSEEAQAWAFKNLRPQCNPDFIAISRGGYHGATDKDLIVQQRMFVLCLDSTGRYIKDAKTTQRECLASYKPAIVYGFWSKEVPDVAFLSSFGHTEGGDAPNDSVYWHLPKPAEFKQKSFGEPPQYDPAKTYIFVSFSQGDSLRFCQKFNLWHLTQKSATAPGKLVRERYPFGLMHSTLQYGVQPIVPNVLYDLVVAPGPSGLAGQWFAAKGYGYANPSTLEEHGFLDLYLNRSREAMRRMGIVDFMLNDRGVEGDPSRKIVTKIARVLKPRSIIMKHQLDAKEQFDDPVAFIEGVPVFPDPVFDLDDPDSPKEFDVNLTVQRILESQKKRQFFWVFLRHQVTVADLEKLMDKLAAEHKNIVVLNPDVFIRFCLNLAKGPAVASKAFARR